MILTLLTTAAFVYSKPFVDKSSCAGCGDCVAQCPTGAISISGEKATIDPEKCIDCKICVRACTYKAIRTPN